MPLVKPSCLVCASDTVSQCKNCSVAYYCSTECHRLDKTLGHNAECSIHVDDAFNEDVQNCWTGLMLKHSIAFRDFSDTMAQEYDEKEPSVQNAEKLLQKSILDWSHQTTSRDGPEVLQNFHNTLRDYVVSDLLSQKKAEMLFRNLKTTQKANLSALFSQNTTTFFSHNREDFEKALDHMIGAYRDYVETLKTSKDTEIPAAKVDKISLLVGQVFWGRKYNNSALFDMED